MRRFSVIVPVYNAESYLKHCLDSILNQTFQDFEIVIVNDGSTDSSADICRQYQESNPEKIILINQDNKGIFVARKIAFLHAQGEIIVSVDSDDALRADALEILDRTFRKTQAQIVCYESTRDITFNKPSKNRGLFSGEEVFEGRQKRKLYELICGTLFFNNLCFKAISRDVIDVKDYYSECGNLSFGEDAWLVLPALDRAKKIIYIPDSLYFYRLNASSSVHIYRQKQFDDLLVVRNRVMGYAKKWQQSFSVDGLVDETKAMTLYLIVLQMQDAMMALPYEDAKKTLIRVQQSAIFCEAYASVKHKKTRPDIRIVALMIKYHNIWGIRLVSCLKNILLGKNRD